MSKIYNTAVELINDAKDEFVDAVCAIDSTDDAVAFIMLMTLAIAALVALFTAVVAMIVLCPVAVAIILGAFAIPTAIYAYVRVKHGLPVFGE